MICIIISAVQVKGYEHFTQALAFDKRIYVVAHHTKEMPRDIILLYKTGAHPFHVNVINK